MLDEALKVPREVFSPDVDGYFLPENCSSIYAAGKQSHIPLLAGWNMDEGNFGSFFVNEKPTVENYAAHANVLFGDHAKTFFKTVPGVDRFPSKAGCAGFRRR